MSHKSPAKTLWNQCWGPKSPSLPFLPVLSPLSVRSLRRKQGCVLKWPPGNPTPAAGTPGIQIYWDCIAGQGLFFLTPQLMSVRAEVLWYPWKAECKSWYHFVVSVVLNNYVTSWHDLDLNYSSALYCRTSWKLLLLSFLRIFKDFSPFLSIHNKSCK